MCNTKFGWSSAEVTKTHKLATLQNLMFHASRVVIIDSGRQINIKRRPRNQNVAKFEVSSGCHADNLFQKVCFAEDPND